MKIKVLTAVFATTILLASCSGGDKNSNGDSTVYDETRPVGENHLEDLLGVKDEAALKSMFAADRVTYDTIWGAEGMYTMGTYVDKGTTDEVQIYWEDSLHRSGVDAVFIGAIYSNDGKYNFSNKWSSKSGVKLGMTTDELENLNKKPFNFSGFGWDYGGGVMSWNNGGLEDKNVGVTLTEGDGKITEDEMSQVLGDQEIKSNDPVVKKMQPKVVRLSVH
ncbi:MAG: hypothetical protein M3R17_11100 [Bacteroidota bacterium]|nr:hypothetical protein [Bacteroidota bacterium]